MKDDIIGRLNEELVKKEGMIRAEVDSSFFFLVFLCLFVLKIEFFSLF